MTRFLLIFGIVGLMGIVLGCVSLFWIMALLSLWKWLMM